MEAWLIYDEEGAKRNQDYIQYHKEAGESMGIAFTLMMAEELDLCIPQHIPAFALVRTINPALSKKLEQAGIYVLNSSLVSEICNDKGKTINYIQESTNVPVVPTRCFHNEKLSQALLEKHKESVIKAVDGHGGKQVFRTEEDYTTICQGIGKSDFIIQPFIHGPGQDVRVYVIGNKTIAAVERTSCDGFKSNFSLGGAVRSYSLSPTEQSLVNQICAIFSFGMVGIDFIINDKNELLLNEIEDVVGARMLYQCQPDIHLLEKYFSFILESILHYH